MLERLKNWLEERISDGAPPKNPALRQSGAHQLRPPVAAPAVSRKQTNKAPQQAPKHVEFCSRMSGKLEDAGPGKNVLVRRQYIREETGTYETLKIVDESLDDSDEGFSDDPYNTGGFDRSKNWGNRFRK